MRYACTEEIVAIRLSDGEDVHSSLAFVCRENDIDSAVIVSASGMVREVTFGWFNGHEYLKENRDQVFELLSLNGNLSYRTREIYPHLHATLGTQDHQVLGGHILKAIVDHNLEVFLKPLNTVLLGREFDGWFEAIVPVRRR
jgi:predicted DNA-binding protein with PD1-like motif